MNKEMAILFLFVFGNSVLFTILEFKKLEVKEASRITKEQIEDAMRECDGRIKYVDKDGHKCE